MLVSAKLLFFKRFKWINILNLRSENLKVLEEFNNQNYQYIYDNIDKIVESIGSEINESNDSNTEQTEKVKVYEYIFESYFNIEKFDLLIEMYSKLQKVKMETYPLCMYTLLACVGLKDVYLAISYIRKSNCLKELKWYLSEDGSNYYNFLKESIDVQMLLIVVTFINKLECEIDEDSFEYSAGVTYYELISLLFEIGYSKEVIKRLTEIGYILFK